nr:MAG TPA: hypothetical protein [Caudoviricetes sp.]
MCSRDSLLVSILCPIYASLIIEKNTPQIYNIT